MAPSNILFILSGSIACYKACEVISQLVQRGCRVRTAATAGALRFVGETTLEGLTGEKVAHDVFAPGAAMDHIALARWAEITVICPATANTLNRVAAGLADDLAGALLLAHDWRKPLLIAPAMNPMMRTHPATVAAIERLQSWGAQFVHGTAGRTACGEIGEGRMAEADEIVAAVVAASSRPGRKLKVLITSGGTVEPIDGVRVISNLSSGETGARIAEHFAGRGHDVLLLRARAATPANAPCREETFSTFAELDVALQSRLREESFDAVIHAAAVSDFSVRAIELDGVKYTPAAGSKLPSDVAPILHLGRNPKLLQTLRGRSRYPGVRIVAFKLTQNAEPAMAQAAAAALVAGGEADFVVHNDLAARPLQGAAFPATIWRQDGTLAARCPDRLKLAHVLEALLLGEDVAEPGGDPKSQVDGSRRVS